MAQALAATKTPVEPISVLDALLWAPVDFRDYTSYKGSVGRAVQAGCGKAIFKLKVIGKSFERNGKIRIAVKATDGAGALVDMAVFDTEAFDEWKAIPPQSTVFVEGTPNVWNDRLQIKSPVLVPPSQQGRVVPVYRGKKGLSAQSISELVQSADRADIDAVIAYVQEITQKSEADILRGAKARAKSLADLFLDLHIPKTVSAGEAALADARRIAIKQIIDSRAADGRAPTPRSGLAVPRETLNVYVKRMPFRLSADQVRCVKEIADDLRSTNPMNRILTGDVGTGKTAVFALLAAAVQHHGGKVAILVPNQLLVDQIAGDFAAWWPEIPVQKIKSGSRISDLENNPILIGTTALIFQLGKQAQWEADFVIADEQHKQSSRIRESLLRDHSNLLEATATPIPRSAALITYGSMSISTLRECPVQKTIHTRVATAADREQVFKHIKEIVQQGSQVAVIYPRVSDEEKTKSSVEQAAAGWEKILPGRVGMLHGRMSDAEKESTIARMKARQFDLLVSSTVLEVGVSLPDLYALMVVNPDRYGVAQLHQMRGRVARKGGVGYFYMLSQGSIAPETQERLDLLVQYNDGYVLAEKDAEMRGFGDLSSDSEMQAGATKCLFNAIKLMPSDFVEVMGGI